MRKTLCVLALTFAVVAPAIADDAKSIAQRLDDKWIEAFNKKDAAALAALYTADAVLLPQGADQPIVGTENIRKFMDQMVKEKIENMALPVAQATMIDPNSLYQAGTWTADAGGQQIKGTFLSVLAKDGSNWKYRADTWNMVPPSPATTGSASTNK
jgi:uncharacterized protein (TIGR02246 family)